jgi:hypothetical protein
MLELEEKRQYDRSRDVGLVGSHDVTGLYEESKSGPVEDQPYEEM